jgi:hypothetical protein
MTNKSKVFKHVQQEISYNNNDNNNTHNNQERIIEQQKFLQEDIAIIQKATKLIEVLGKHLEETQCHHCNDLLIEAWLNNIDV